MNKLIIMRGIPGSGKSTKVKEILDNAWNDGFMTVDVHSADNYFLRPDGVYDFNPKMLKNAHKWCREGVERSMTQVCPMDSETPFEPDPTDLVIVDNTHTCLWEYQPYLDMAEKYGYDVEVIVVGEFTEEAIDTYAKRNTHGVPYEKVLEMAARFEF